MRIFSEDQLVLVVDIGNTNTVCSIYRHGESIWSARLQSERERTSDEYYSRLSSLLCHIPSAGQINTKESGSASADYRSCAFSLSEINYVALGSVVPELSRIWRHLLQKYTSAKVFEINGLSPLDMHYKVGNPSALGADLVANGFAAWKKYRQSAIVIDLGTATTIQVISNSGVFEGAAIAPGLKTGATNLFAKAAQLFELEITPPTALLGTNTHDAVLSGIVYGHAFMLESFIYRLKEQYNHHAPLITILTGGMASLIMPYLPCVEYQDKNLTMDGFYLALTTLMQS